jgi:hypothetical protein
MVSVELVTSIFRVEDLEYIHLPMEEYVIQINLKGRSVFRKQERKIFHMIGYLIN